MVEGPHPAPEALWPCCGACCGDEDASLSAESSTEFKDLPGTSANAVKRQIWTALIAMLILKYLQMKSTFGRLLSNLAACCVNNCSFFETREHG
jgi:hypothetical protein